MVTVSPARSGIFFMSSNGSMATQWLSTILSASPRVQCFHGTLGLLSHRKADLPLQKVIEALQTQAGQKGIFTGVVHLNNRHGTEAAQAIGGAQGHFTALLRNPIEVVNSQFIAKSSMPNRAEFAHTWLTHQRRSSTLPLAWLHPDDAVFARGVVMALKHYFECAALVPERRFLFETYTQDYGEVQRLLRVITGGEITDCPDVAKAYRETGRLNQHHQVPVAWDTIFFQQWDESQRYIFKGVYRDTEALVPAPLLPAFSHYPFLRELCAA